jgi:hypothetical protein
VDAKVFASAFLNVFTSNRRSVSRSASSAARVFADTGFRCVLRRFIGMPEL